MKNNKNKPLLFIVMVCMAWVCNGQEFQGKAYYTSKTEVDMSNFGRPDMTEEQKARMAERLKRMFEKTFVLTFNKTESVFKVEEQLEAPSQGQGRGRFGAILSAAMDGIVYKNIKTKQLLSEHELFGKLFLVKSELPQLEWKMTGETKQIGAYTCFKATAIKTWRDFDINKIRRSNQTEENSDVLNGSETQDSEEVEVVAWYTMQIPVSAGPGGYWGLPGLILEVSTDKTTMLCSKIVLNPKDKTSIKEPSKGKEVSREEYVEIAAEKYTEMRENFRRRGGGRGQ